MAQHSKHGFALLRTAFALAVSSALAVLACGSDERSGAWSGTGGDHVNVPGTEACSDGASRECHVTVSEKNGVLTCLSGDQMCVAGTWGECSGDTLSEMAAPGWYQSGGGLHAQALSSNADCNPENPCDPSCQQYDENPPSPLTPTQDDGGTFTSNYNWNWGSLAAFPGGLVTKGIIEPCHSAYDCQFNEYCQYPNSGTCGHGMCSTGAALTTACDNTATTTKSCVKMICDIDPTCCTATSCAHSLCQTGTNLTSGCGATVNEEDCTTAICASRPACCSGTWDSTCVEMVNSVCKPANQAQCDCNSGETSNGGHCYKYVSTATKWASASCGTGWYLAHISSDSENTAVSGLSTANMWIGGVESSSAWQWNDDASSVTAPTGITLPTVTNNYALYITTTDTWSKDQKNNMSAEWGSACEGLPSVFTVLPGSSNAWTASCVSKVKTVCGSVCDTAASPQSTGYCQPYPAGYIDSTCASWNVTVAPTCTGAIPVCNHGTVQAPSGLRVYSFQGNSDHYPWCNPTIQVNDNYCTTTQVIPPGECISVTGCTLDNNGEVIVNPTTAANTAYVSGECDCKDNWSLVNKTAGECEEPGCGTADGFYPSFVTACEAAVPSTNYETGSAVTISHVYDDNKNNTTDDPVAFTYLSSSTGCATTPLGWYYNADKTKFMLCTGTGSACARVQDSANYVVSKVYVELSCDIPPQYQTTSVLNTYTGTCGTDRGVQWSYLTYSATIPSDAEVQFRFASASTAAGLPTTTDPTNSAWSTAVVRTSTQASCTSTADPCAVSIYDALGQLPNAQLQYLAVLITLVPSSDNQGPQVNNWDITYSCPFNQ